MKQQFIYYDQPLNEHIRVLLRLENRFQQIKYCLHKTSEWDSRVTLASIVDGLALLDRADLKTKLISEITKYQLKLKRIQGTSDVDQHKLLSIMEELEQALVWLRELKGKFCQNLRTQGFFEQTRAHLQMPNGGASCDAPAFHFWLKQPAPVRIEQLECWWESIAPIEAVIAMFLQVLRGSQNPKEFIARKGFYQAPLNAQVDHQLLTVALPLESSHYPEISAGRHRVTIRFYQHNVLTKPAPAINDLSFELTCCCL